MTTLISSPLFRRIPLSVMLSVALHGSLIACVLYASFHQVVKLPEAFQPMSVSMIAPEMQPAPPVQTEPVSEPVAVPPQPQVQSDPEPVQPDLQPDPLPAESKPVPESPLPVPVAKPKPKPKPVKKRLVKENDEKKATEVRKVPTAVNTAPTSQPAATSSRPSAGPKLSTSSSSSVAGGPQVLSLSKPGYPARAYALRMEGKVRVQFDVNSDGRVDNIRILAAEPRNMFEREVKQAMNKWRYQPGRPGTNMIMNIVFRIDGGSQME